MIATRIVSCHFNGIYAWTGGFVSEEAYDAWHSFWNGVNDRKKDASGDVHCWQYCRPVDNISCGYLVSTAGSIYLHPTGFHAILYSAYGGPDLRLIRELRRLCREVAEACGGSCSFTMTELHEIPAMKTEILPE